jgi:hypothetical protein
MPKRGQPLYQSCDRCHYPMERLYIRVHAFYDLKHVGRDNRSWKGVGWYCQLCLWYLPDAAVKRKHLEYVKEITRDIPPEIKKILDECPTQE